MKTITLRLTANMLCPSSAVRNVLSNLFSRFCACSSRKPTTEETLPALYRSSAQPTDGSITCVLSVDVEDAEVEASAKVTLRNMLYYFRVIASTLPGVLSIDYDIDPVSCNLEPFRRMFSLDTIDYECRVDIFKQTERYHDSSTIEINANAGDRRSFDYVVYCTNDCEEREFDLLVGRVESSLHSIFDCRLNSSVFSVPSVLCKYDACRLTEKGQEIDCRKALVVNSSVVDAFFNSAWRNRYCSGTFMDCPLRLTSMGEHVSLRPSPRPEAAAAEAAGAAAGQPSPQ